MSQTKLGTSDFPAIISTAVTADRRVDPRIKNRYLLKIDRTEVLLLCAGKNTKKKKKRKDVNNCQTSRTGTHY